MGYGDRAITAPVPLSDECRARLDAERARDAAQARLAELVGLPAASAEDDARRLRDKSWSYTDPAVAARAAAQLRQIELAAQLRDLLHLARVAEERGVALVDQCAYSAGRAAPSARDTALAAAWERLQLALDDERSEIARAWSAVG